MPREHSIQVIDRMVHLLDILSSHDQAVSLKIISAESGLHPSTAYRILAVMIGHHFVEKNVRSDYQLGKKLLQLGNRVKSHMNLRNEAKPVMQRLRDELGETINLAVAEDYELVYIERISGLRTIRAEQVIGSRAPLHVTAVGKMMLADRGERWCRNYARDTGLPAFTDSTICDIDQLLAEVASAAQSGFALDNEEAEPGMGCVGVLVRDSSGQGVAGLSVSAPIERREKLWNQSLLAAGRELSTRLGFSTR